MHTDEYQRLVENSPLAMLVVQGGLVVWANRAATELCHREPVGTAVADLLDPADRAELAAVLSGEVEIPGTPGGPVVEWRVIRPDAGSIVVEVQIGTAEFRGAPAVSLACWDVSEHVARQRDLSHRATHDRLTDLPNRTLLEDRWQLLRSRADRSGRPPLVVFCDVDDLKRVNDSAGHAAGDAVLVRVAEVLASEARGEDTVARFGGDEFVVLAENPGGAGATALADRLAEALAAVAVVLPDGTEISVHSSVGSVVDDPTRPLSEVLAQADQRMYERKRGRRA